MDFHLVDLPLSRPGFRRFVSAWLLRDTARDRTYIVDPGPPSTWFRRVRGSRGILLGGPAAPDARDPVLAFPEVGVDARTSPEAVGP